MFVCFGQEYIYLPFILEVIKICTQASTGDKYFFMQDQQVLNRPSNQLDLKYSTQKTAASFAN